MPQCKECFKPIASAGLCRPCREESLDPNDVTQEFPTQALEDDAGWVPPPSPPSDDEEFLFRDPHQS